MPEKGKQKASSPSPLGTPNGRIHYDEPEFQQYAGPAAQIAYDRMYGTQQQDDQPAQHGERTPQAKPSEQTNGSEEDPQPSTLNGADTTLDESSPFSNGQSIYTPLSSPSSQQQYNPSPSPLHRHEPVDQRQSWPSIIRQNARHIFSRPDLSFSSYYRCAKDIILCRREQRERFAESAVGANPLGTHHPLNTQINGTVPEVVSGVTSPTGSRSPEQPRRVGLSPEQRQRIQSLSTVESRLHQPRSNFPILDPPGQAVTNGDNPSPTIVAPVPRNRSSPALILLQRNGQGPAGLPPILETLPPILETNVIPPTPPSTGFDTGVKFTTNRRGSARQIELPTNSNVGAQLATLAAYRAGRTDHLNAESDSSGTLSDLDGHEVNADDEASRADSRAPPARHHAGQQCPGFPQCWLPSDARLAHLGTHLSDDQDANDLQEGDRSITASRAGPSSGGRIPGVGANWVPSERNAASDPTRLTPTAQARPRRCVEDIQEGEAGPSSNFAPLPDPTAFDLTDADLAALDTALINAASDANQYIADQLERSLSPASRPPTTSEQDEPIERPPAPRVRLPVEQHETVERSPSPRSQPQPHVQLDPVDDPSRWRFMEGTSQNTSWTHFWPGELRRTSHVHFNTYLQDHALQRELQESIDRAPIIRQRRPDTINEADVDSQHEASGPLPGPTPLPIVRLPASPYRGPDTSEARDSAAGTPLLNGPGQYPFPQPLPVSQAPIIAPLNPGDVPVKPRASTPGPSASPAPSTASDDSDGLVMHPSAWQRGRARERLNLVLDAARNRTRTREQDEAEAVCGATSGTPQSDEAISPTSTEPPIAPTQAPSQNDLIARLAAQADLNWWRRPERMLRHVLLLLRRYSDLGERRAIRTMGQWSREVMERDWSPVEPIDYLQHPLRPVPVARLSQMLIDNLSRVEGSRIARGLSLLSARDYDGPMGFPEAAFPYLYYAGAPAIRPRRRLSLDLDVDANGHILTTQAQRARQEFSHERLTSDLNEAVRDQPHLGGLDTVGSWHNSGWNNSDAQLDARPGEHRSQLEPGSFFRQRFALRPLYGAGEWFRRRDLIRLGRSRNRTLQDRSQDEVAEASTPLVPLSRLISPLGEGLRIAMRERHTIWTPMQIAGHEYNFSFFEILHAVAWVHRHILMQRNRLGFVQDRPYIQRAIARRILDWQRSQRAEFERTLQTPGYPLMVPGPRDVVELVQMRQEEFYRDVPLNAPRLSTPRITTRASFSGRLQENADCQQRREGAGPPGLAYVTLWST